MTGRAGMGERDRQAILYVAGATVFMLDLIATLLTKAAGGSRTTCYIVASPIFAICTVFFVGIMVALWKDALR